MKIKKLRLDEDEFKKLIVESTQRVLKEYINRNLGKEEDNNKPQKYTIWIAVHDRNGGMIDDFKETCIATNEKQAVEKIKNEYHRQFDSGRYKIDFVSQQKD